MTCLRTPWTWIATAALAGLPAWGCGAKQKPAEDADEAAQQTPSGDGDGGAAAAAAPGDNAPGATGPAVGTEDEKPTPKVSPCTGFEMDLLDALGQSACEVPNAKPDAKPRDLKAALDVKLLASPNKIQPGAHVDIFLTLTNKTAALLPLDFRIDPLPRFEIEVYSAKNAKRVDMPAGDPPKVPAGTSREPSTPSTARITLAANGKATVKLGWDAMKMRWAPEKLKGTPPEQGYPRAPAGPLPKGTYSVRVVTPLINVFEGVDHEVSAPRALVEVSK